MDLPVKDAEEQVNCTEHQELLIQQSVDASPPPEQEPGESIKPDVGHLQRVRNRHVEAGAPGKLNKLLVQKVKY